MVHVNPPYRCDVVGSFLRPKTVAQARVKFSCGQISKEELTAIEDAEIKKLIAKERENGLSAVTDGEFRRAYWQCAHQVHNSFAFDAAPDLLRARRKL